MWDLSLVREKGRRLCVLSQIRILSLSEIMKTFGVFVLATNLQTLARCRDSLQLLDSTIGTPADDGFIEILASVLGNLNSACEEFGADSSLVLSIANLTGKLGDGTADRRTSVLLAQINLIHAGIQNNLEKRHFMLLSEEEATFYTNPDLFGESFREKYPARAIKDVFDAGSSYAASLYTACVFHCMRVAEYGLRKLASNRILRVKLTKKGRRCPIEYGTWQEVIDAIQAKIRKIRQRPVGPKRESELQFLSSAADHCEYMKDIWRNELSHTRRTYKKAEALAVIHRVKDFVTAVGEHRGSPAATDSVVRLLQQWESQQQANQSVPIPDSTTLPPPIN
jgi:hypothetical protein